MLFLRMDLKGEEAENCTMKDDAIGQAKRFGPRHNQSFERFRVRVAHGVRRRRSSDDSVCFRSSVLCSSMFSCLLGQGG